MGDDEKQEMGEKMVAPADFKGPADKRGCTDILCLLLIVAHWVAMTYLGIWACTTGDYRLVLYPMDVDGNICGIDSDVTDKPYLYYVNVYSTGVCVSECPSVSDTVDFTASFGAAGKYDPTSTYSDISVHALSDISTVCDATSTLDVDCINPAGDYIKQGKGYGFPILDTYAFMNRCMLTQNATSYIETTLASGSSMASSNDESLISQIYTDLWTSIAWILGFGFCVSMLVSFAYTFLLRIPGVLFIMVWGCIASVFALLAGIGAYGYTLHTTWSDDTTEEYQEHTDAERDALLYCSYGFFVLAGVWFLLICFLRARIQLALAIVKQAAKAVAAMPLIILFPVMQCAGFVVFMSIWLVYAVYLASMGERADDGICSSATYLTETLCEAAGEIWVKYQYFEYNDEQSNAGWYLLFCYFWSSQFIIAVGQIVIAMCIAKWYFARDKSVIGNVTVIGSIKDSLYYHTGTAAFGSLIIAIIKMIRAAIMYAQKKAKQSGSKVAQAVLCALQCYMYCMEKCMKFLNKNAYIQTAIFGTNFCVSAKNAFFLILRNIARIGACTMVSEFVILIGKVFICVFTGGMAYFALASPDVGLDLYSPLAPVFFIMVMSYFTASMFMNIFGMGIATILQCFIADEEMFDASSRFAESELADFIDTNGAPPKAAKEDNTL